MTPELRTQKPYPMAELARRKAVLVDQGAELFDFGTGDPIEPTPVFIREALVAAIPEISQYPSVAGTPELRAAAAGWLARRFGVDLDPATQILPSAGSKEAIFHLPLAFCDPSSERDTVVYGTPAYPVYAGGSRFAGARLEPVVLERERDFRLDLTALPGEVLDRTAIAWFNYPHNPTGATVDRAYYAEQYACCRDHGILMASDECYADLFFDQPCPSALEVGTEGLLVFQSCSKRSGMTGYRSGFIAGDAALIAEYRRWRVSMGVASAVFVEAAGAAAWNDDDHVAERRRIFAAKRDLLTAGLRERGLDVLPCAAGLSLWVGLPPGTPAEDYAATCLESGIVISPGDFFGPGGEGFVRLALVPTLEDCRRALERWPQTPT